MRKASNTQEQTILLLPTDLKEKTIAASLVLALSFIIMEFKSRNTSNRKVEEALDFFDREGIALHSLLVAYKDELITECYCHPFERDTLHRMYSVTKSINALGIGILLKKGMLSLDDRLSSLFPEYITEKTDERIKNTTIRNLLMMKSPYSRTCYKIGVRNGNNVSLYPDDWVSSFFTNTPDHDADTFFSYDTGAATVLSRIVEKVSGMKYMDFMRDNLFSPLGISKETYILSDNVGNPQGGSGIMMRPIDLLKIIYLVKEGGMGIIDEDYLKDATSPLSDTTLASMSNMRERRMGYGYQIWSVGDGAYAFVGLGGQFAVAVPDKDIVFVTTADTQIYDAYSSLILKTLLGVVENIDLEDEVKAKERSTVFLENKAECHLSDMHFAMDENPIGVGETTLSFSRNNGSLTIVKNGDKEVYPFAFGKNALIELKEKSSSPALSSASYNSDGTLSIWVQFIGECLGGLTVEIGIKEKRISMRMRLVGELMFEGYSGVLTGTLR